MSLLATILLAALVITFALALLTLFVWRRTDPESKALVKRISRLRLKAKFRLAVALARDRRIPLLVRGIPPALVLYLAMPLDLGPDFIPVLGQLDDVLIVLVGIGLLLRFTPRSVLEEHIISLETAA